MWTSIWMFPTISKWHHHYMYCTDAVQVKAFSGSPITTVHLFNIDIDDEISNIDGNADYLNCCCMTFEMLLCGLHSWYCSFLYHFMSSEQGPFHTSSKLLKIPTSTLILTGIHLIERLDFRYFSNRQSFTINILFHHLTHRISFIFLKKYVRQLL